MFSPIKDDVLCTNRNGRIWKDKRKIKGKQFYRGAIILIIVNNHNVKANAKLKKS